MNLLKIRFSRKIILLHEGEHLILAQEMVYSLQPFAALANGCFAIRQVESKAVSSKQAEKRVLWLMGLVVFFF